MSRRVEILAGGQAAIARPELGTKVVEIFAPRKGSPGPKGDPGEPGDDGSAGLSAFEVAVQSGFVGTEAEWLISLKGPKGDPGEPGGTTIADIDGLGSALNNKAETSDPTLHFLGYGTTPPDPSTLPDGRVWFLRAD